MSQQNPSQPQTIVIRHESKAPQELPSAAQVFEEAKAKGWRLTIVLNPTSDADTALTHRRRHDLLAAVRTLDLSVKALTGGYRFDDPQAGAKIAAMQRAVQCLEREVGTLSDLLLID